MPGSVPVTPSDISIIRLQVGEEPEWCDLLQEAREKKRMKFTSVSSGDVRECHGQRFGSQQTSCVLQTQYRPACRPNPKRLAFFSHFSGLFWEKSPFRLFHNFFLQIFALFRPLECDIILCPLLTLNFVLFTSSEQSDSLN